VNLQSGAQETVAPYIWGDMGQFSLGNLLDERHGLIYTLERRTLAGYDFAIDRDQHQRLHRLADFQHAFELHERAAALHRAQRPDAASREATFAAPALDSLSNDALWSTSERGAIYQAR